MEFKYEIKGVTLNKEDMQVIAQYYEDTVLANYLIATYNISDEEAVDKVKEIRRFEREEFLEEDDAIDEVMVPPEETLPINWMITEDQIKEYCPDWSDLNEEEQEEVISDYITEATGFCHKGFLYSISSYGWISVTGIQWDTEE